MDFFFLSVDNERRKSYKKNIFMKKFFYANENFFGKILFTNFLISRFLVNTCLYCLIIKISANEFNKGIQATMIVSKTPFPAVLNPRAQKIKTRLRGSTHISNGIRA